MITKVIMPQLGQTMEEGIITQWLKKEGEKVEKGEILFEITTDKATVEAESFSEGILRKIIVKAGEAVPVLITIAIIADENEDIEAVLKEVAMEKKLKEEIILEKKELPKEEKKEKDKEQIKISPAAKKIVKEKNIDISKVYGTGPSGRITEKDVLNFIKNKETVLLSPSIDLTNTQKIIATKMNLSKRTIPHFYLTKEVDMENIVEIKKNIENLISINDFIIKITASVLKKYPKILSFIIEEKIYHSSEINIGFAISYNDELLVPVIRNADKKGLLQISEEVKTLTEKIKNKKILPQDLENATFTISNLGMYEIDNFIAIINPPQVAIMAVSSIISKPIVSNDEITIRKRMNITLSCDHRLLNGVYVAIFLKELKTTIETVKKENLI